MDWNEFISQVCPYFLKEKVTKVPTNYDEFCELYETYHDLPPLTEKDPESESHNYRLSDSYSYYE